MKQIFLTIFIITICSFCCGCDAIDAINPVVQTAKMQNTAKQITDDAVQMKKYSEDMQKKELEKYNLNY